MDQPKPSIGRTVHFVLPAGSPREGEHRAAVITGVHPDTCNLTVFADQRDDLGGHAEGGPFGATFRVWSARQDESGEPNTWHWPERDGEAKPAWTAERTFGVAGAAEANAAAA